MDKKTQNILRYIFWGAVAVVLVYFCLKAVDWPQFMAALEQCRWGYVLLAIVLGGLALFLRGARWHMLLRPIDPTTQVITCFNAYNICMAANLALPRLGEVIRLGYPVKHSAVGPDGKRVLSFDKVLGTVVVERAWDAVVSLGMLAAVLFMEWDVLSRFLQETMGGALHPGTLLTGLAVLLVLSAAFVYLAYRLRDKGMGQIWGFIRGIGNGLASFAHMRHPWLFLLYTVLIWVLHWLTSASIIWALQGIDAFAALTLKDAFLIMVLGSVSSIVPVPGGFGAYHGMVAGALLSIWNIPMGLGMIYATLNHESQVLMQAILGLGSYIHESFFRK